MGVLTKPIIEYVPHLLEYCQKEKGLSLKTIKNYKQFLKRFVIWLKQSNQTDLSPGELSLKHIQEYKDYLSKQISPQSNQPITKKTQNYYLIALRALLSYFIEKNIPSLLPHKINLLKEEKIPRSVDQSLSLGYFKKLIEMPEASTIIEIRDKALLETLFSTGLKVSQLVSLNRNQIEIGKNVKNLEIKISNKDGFYTLKVYLSEKSIKSLKKYLKTRKDKEKALFINYKSRKTTSRRLTVRSVEKIVRKYSKRANLSFLFTPETLRNAHILSILNKEGEIKITQNPLPHKTLIVQNYKFTLNKELLPEKTNKFPSWHTAEIMINKEIKWLKNNIPVLAGGYTKNPSLISCDNCLLRKIAILIVSGKVKVTELKAINNNNLWNDLTKRENFQKINRHGKEWHRRMMDVISEYFETKDCKIFAEPILNYGRADLGVYLKSSNPLYVEIGTVSLFKLWYNFSTARNASFLLVPSEKHAIEFKV